MFFKRAARHPRMFLIVFNEFCCVESRVAVFFQRRVLVFGASLTVVNSYVFFVVLFCPNNIVFLLYFVLTHVCF